MEITLYVFLPNGVFLPCDHGLDFGISLLCWNSINHLKKVIFVGVQSINTLNMKSYNFYFFFLWRYHLFRVLCTIAISFCM